MCTLASMSLLTAFISRPRSLLPQHRLVSKENPLSLRPAQSHTAEPTAPPQGLSGSLTCFAQASLEVKPILNTRPPSLTSPPQFTVMPELVLLQGNPLKQSSVLFSFEGVECKQQNLIFQSMDLGPHLSKSDDDVSS